MAVAFSAIVEAFAAMESVMLLVDRCQKERSIDVVLDVQSKGPIKAGNQRSLFVSSQTGGNEGPRWFGNGASASWVSDLRRMVCAGGSYQRADVGQCEAGYTLEMLRYRHGLRRLPFICCTIGRQEWYRH